MKDEKLANGWNPIKADAEDAAVDKTKTNSLTGWETAETEYRAVSSRQVESAPNVDVIV